MRKGRFVAIIVPPGAAFTAGMIATGGLVRETAGTNRLGALRIVGWRSPDAVRLRGPANRGSKRTCCATTSFEPPLGAMVTNRPMASYV